MNSHENRIKGLLMPGHYKCSQFSLSPFTCAVSFVSVWVVVFCGLVVLGFLLLLFLIDFRITVSILIQWWLCMMSFITQKLQSCNIQLVTGYEFMAQILCWSSGTLGSQRVLHGFDRTWYKVYEHFNTLASQCCIWEE